MLLTGIIQFALNYPVIRIPEPRLVTVFDEALDKFFMEGVTR